MLLPNKKILSILFFSFSLMSASPVIGSSTTLRLAIGSEPTEGFDPMLGWSHGSYLLLHSPLLKQKKDLSWQSYLLENYTVNSNGLEWTLKLKPNLKFSDGSPLTAEDVVFTYNNAAKAGGKIDMGNFSQAEIIDNLTARIKLSRPQSTFINVLGSLGIVCAAQYDEKKYAKSPIGAGPYRLVSYQPSQQLIVEKNPYYAGPSNPFNRLIFIFLDEDIAYAAAQSGQLDIVRIAANTANHNQPIKQLKLVQRASVENRGISFPMQVSGQTNMNGEAIGNDVTADIAIRKAINYAINRQQLADTIFDGFAIPAYTGVQGLPWNNQTAFFQDANCQQAIDILEQNGWHLNKNNIREKNGIEAKLTLWYASGDVSRRDLSQAIKAYLTPIGIDINTQSASWETIEKKMYSNPVLFGWGSLDPMELVHYYSSQSSGVGYYNPGYYHNPVVDKHLQQALDASTQDQAIAYWQLVDWDGQTGTGIKGDSAWAWLLNIKHTYLVNKCVELGEAAPEIHGSWSLLNNLDEWGWTCH